MLSPSAVCSSSRSQMSARYDVDGLAIVVVGGTTGMGLSAAKRLVESGARVVVTSRSEQNVRQALDELGAGARGFAADAVLPDAAERAVAVALESFGRFDGLYH